MSASVQGRAFWKRTGITRHPIQKIDQKIKDKIREEWIKRKKTIIKKGDRVKTQGTAGQSRDGEPAAESDSERVSADVEGTANVDPNLEGTAKVNAVKSNVLAKAGLASAVIGFTCLIKGLADGAQEIEQQNIIERSERIGGYMMGLGNQVMAGKDLDVTQLGLESEQMFDESDDKDDSTKPSSYFDDQSIKQEQGQPGGVPLMNSAKLGGTTNTLSEIVGQFPFLGPICAAASSFLGQVVSFGLDLIAGPVGAVFSGGIGFLAGPYIGDIARHIAGESIPSDVAGAALGGVANQGAFFIANQQFATMGATALTEPERAELKQQAKETDSSFAYQKSWTERYFSLTDPDSLVAKAIDGYRPTPVASNFAKLPSTLLGNFANIFWPKARATSSYNYGPPKLAMRPSEIVLFDSDETYANPYINEEVIDAQIPEFNKKYSEKCFGITFDDNEKFTVGTPVNMMKYPEECRRTDDAFIRYRLYVGDLMTHLTSACYEGDETVCNELGFGSGTSASTGTSSSIIGDPYTDSTGVPCAEGTKDLDIHDGYVDGKLIKLRMCALPNITSTGQSGIPGGESLVNVNSRVAGAWLALVNDAKAAGISLAATSSFRSMSNQQGLCQKDARCSNGDYTMTAKPGYSSHQAGVAIDFGSGMSGITGGSTCSTRAKAPNSPAWVWLRDNAEHYGFKQYSAEAWHWDALPSGNRCGTPL